MSNFANSSYRRTINREGACRKTSPFTILSIFPDLTILQKRVVFLCLSHAKYFSYLQYFASKLFGFPTFFYYICINEIRGRVSSLKPIRRWVGDNEKVNGFMSHLLETLLFYGQIAPVVSKHKKYDYWNLG